MRRVLLGLLLATPLLLAACGHRGPLSPPVAHTHSHGQMMKGQP